MAEERNGKKYFGLGQVLITVLSFLVMTLIAWAWNLTQDVRVLLEARPRLAVVESTLESARQAVRIENGLFANRMTKLEQVDAGRERELSGIYAQVHDLDIKVNAILSELSSQRASIRYLEGRVADHLSDKPPPER